MYFFKKSILHQRCFNKAEDIDERFDTELGGFRVKNHGKWGLVDAKGKTKIPPVEYAINSKGEIIARQQNRD